jgi:tetratricopeptide (TPR) repeat protein
MKKFMMIAMMLMVVGLFAVSPEVQKYLQEGQKYAQNQEFDKAIASFKKCIELDKSFAPPYFNIALLSMWTEKYEEADKYLREFIKMRDNEPQAYTLLAQLSLELERYNEIEPALQKALQLAPENPAILYNAGDIWLSMNQVEKAYPVLQKGISLLSQKEYNTDLGQKLWWAFLFATMEIDRYDEAMKACDTLLSLSLPEKQKQMVALYKEDIRFFQQNTKNSLFIRAYKVTVGIARGHIDAYRNEIAEQIYFISDEKMGRDKGSLFPPDFLSVVMDKIQVVKVEEASKSGSRSRLSSLFGTMVGSKTLVVEVKTSKGETGYLLFEPLDKRVLLKAAYIPGGVTFMF